MGGKAHTAAMAATIARMVNAAGRTRHPRHSAR